MAIATFTSIDLEGCKVYKEIFEKKGDVSSVTTGSKGRMFGFLVEGSLKVRVGNLTKFYEPGTATPKALHVQRNIFRKAAVDNTVWAVISPSKELYPFQRTVYNLSQGEEITFLKNTSSLLYVAKGLITISGLSMPVQLKANESKKINPSTEINITVDEDAIFAHVWKA